MKCAWICFALFIANSAANEPHGGGGFNRNPYGGGGVNHNLPNEGGGGLVNRNPHGRGGINHDLPRGGGGVYAGEADRVPDVPDYGSDWVTDPNTAAMYDSIDLTNLNTPMQGKIRVPGISAHPSHIHDVLRPEKNPNIKIPSNAQPTSTSHAFRGCEKHPENTKFSSAIGSHYQSEVMSVNTDGAYVAILPQQDMSSPIYITVMMPSFSYEVEVQGSSMMLSRCNMRRQCNLEDESSKKGHDLINPHQWNYLHLMFSDNKMTMDVGDRLEVRSETTISESDMGDAEWVIESGRGLGEEMDGVPFIVQFPCSEIKRKGRVITPSAPAAPTTPVTPFAPAAPSDPSAPTTPVTPAHPQPNPLPKPSHNKNGTAESEKQTGGGGQLAALVIGILVAVILVALLTAVIISAIKKKRSMAVTEDTPLGETNQNYTQDQQKADTQTDTSADTKAAQEVAEP